MGVSTSRYIPISFLGEGFAQDASIVNGHQESSKIKQLDGNGEQPLRIDPRFGLLAQLPHKTITELWTIWIESANGVFLDFKSFKNVYGIVQLSTTYNDDEFLEQLEQVFQLFSQRASIVSGSQRQRRHNHSSSSSAMVDNLEVLSAVILCSQLPREQSAGLVLKFILNFQDSPRVSAKQLAVGLNSVVTGLVKITEEERIVSEQDIIRAAHAAIVEAMEWYEVSNQTGPTSSNLRLGRTSNLLENENKDGDERVALSIAFKDFVSFCEDSFVVAKWSSRFAVSSDKLAEAFMGAPRLSNNLNANGRRLDASKCLEVTILEARRLNDVDILRQQNPFITIEYGSEQQRTHTAFGGGSAPKWNASDNSILRFRISDDVIKSNPKLYLAAYCEPAHHDSTNSRTYKGGQDRKKIESTCIGGQYIDLRRGYRGSIHGSTEQRKQNKSLQRDSMGRNTYSFAPLCDDRELVDSNKPGACQHADMESGAAWYDIYDQHQNRAGQILVAVQVKPELDFVLQSTNKVSEESAQEHSPEFVLSDLPGMQRIPKTNHQFGSSCDGQLLKLKKENHDDQSCPQLHVRMTAVEGNSGDHLRHCARITSSGNVVMVSGRVAVVQDYDNNHGQQQLQLFHQQEIGAIALHPNGKWCATGETSSVTNTTPRIAIWDLDTLKIISVLEYRHGKGVTHMCYLGKDGEYLVIASQQRTISVIKLHQTTNNNIGLHSSSQDDTIECEYVARINQPGDHGEIHSITPFGVNSFAVTGDFGVRFLKLSSSKLVTTKGRVNKFDVAKSHICSVDLTSQSSRSHNNKQEQRDVVLSGTLTGELVIWNDRFSTTKVINAHDGPILSLDSQGGTVVSCSSDGKVKVWNPRLDVVLTITTKHLLTSVSIAPSASTLIVTTGTSSILRFNARTGEPIPIQTESNDATQLMKKNIFPTIGAITSIQAHPFTAGKYCTTHEDGIVQVWEFHHGQSSVVASKQIGGFNNVMNEGQGTRQSSWKCTCCSWSPDGSTIAVGLANDLTSSSSLLISSNKNGEVLLDNEQGAVDPPMGTTVVLLRETNLTFTGIASQPMGDARAIAYSPGGDLLVLSTSLNQVVMLDSSSLGVTQYLESPSTTDDDVSMACLDFSRDGQMIRGQTIFSSKVYYWLALRGKLLQNANAKVLETQKQEQLTGSLISPWYSHSCISSVVDTIGLQDVRSLGFIQSKRFMLLGTGNGKLLIHTYNNNNNLCTTFQTVNAPSLGSLSHICVSNTSNEFVTISQSKGGCSILSNWAFTSPDITQVNNWSCRMPSSVTQRQYHTQTRSVAQLAPPRFKEQVLSRVFGSTHETSAKLYDDEVPPSPGGTLRLQWVYGAQPSCWPGSVCFIDEDSFVFPATGSVIGKMTHDRTAWQQEFLMNAHSRCNVSGIVVAPGRCPQVAASIDDSYQVAVAIWCPQTMKLRRRITLTTLDSISAIAIGGTDNHLIACIGPISSTSELSLDIYDWKSGLEVATCTVHGENGLMECVGIEFLEDQSGLVECGRGYCRFWSLQGSNLSWILGDLNDYSSNSLPSFLSIGWMGGTSVVMGTAEGSICVFEGHKLVETVLAHSGPVTSLFGDHAGLVSAGQDGVVRIWNTSLKPVRSINLSAVNGRLNHHLNQTIAHTTVTSVHRSPSGAKLLVATDQGCVLELSTVDGRNRHDGPLLPGQLGGAIVNVSCFHPDEKRQEFVTATHGESFIMKWQSWTKQRAGVSENLGGVPTAITYDEPTGGTIAVALKHNMVDTKELFHPKSTESCHASVAILNSNSLAIQSQTKALADAEIIRMKYSPDGKWIALVLQTGEVLLLRVSTLAVHQVFNFGLQDAGTTATLERLHVDFSSNSLFVRAGGSCGLIYHDIINHTQVGKGIGDTILESGESSSLTSLTLVSWASHQAILNALETGVWERKTCDVTCCHISDGNPLQVYGNLSGQLRLSKTGVFPSSAGSAFYVAGQAHTSPLSHVSMNQNGTVLLSCGSGMKDNIMVQWSYDLVHNDTVPPVSLTKVLSGSRHSSTLLAAAPATEVSKSQSRRGHHRNGQMIDFMKQDESKIDEFSNVQIPTLAEMQQNKDSCNMLWWTAIMGNVSVYKNGIVPYSEFIEQRVPIQNLNPLKVEWIFSAGVNHGIGNLHHIHPTGEVAYAVGNTIVILNTNNHSTPTQKFLHHESEPIESFCTTQTGALGATVNGGKQQKVWVWDLQAQIPLCELAIVMKGKEHHNCAGGSKLSFSPYGTSLALVDNSTRSMQVWTVPLGTQWSTESVTVVKLADGQRLEGKCNGATTFLFWFSEMFLVRGTLSSIEFWSTQYGGNLSKTKTININDLFYSGVEDAPRPSGPIPTAAIRFGSSIAVGFSSGQVCFINPENGSLQSEIFSAHDDMCISFTTYGTQVLVSNSATEVLLWNMNCTQQHKLQVPFQLPALNGKLPHQSPPPSNDRVEGVVSIAVGSSQEPETFSLYLATESNRLVKWPIVCQSFVGVSNDTAVIGTAPHVVVQGHAVEQEQHFRSCLAAHPLHPNKMVSCSPTDCTIRLWDNLQKSLDSSLVLGCYIPTAVKWHPKGQYLVVGSALRSSRLDEEVENAGKQRSKGKVFFVANSSAAHGGLVVVHSITFAEPVSAIAINTAGSSLAVGTVTGEVRVLGISPMQADIDFRVHESGLEWSVPGFVEAIDYGREAGIHDGEKGDMVRARRVSGVGGSVVHCWVPVTNSVLHPSKANKVNWETWAVFQFNNLTCATLDSVKGTMIVTNNETETVEELDISHIRKLRQPSSTGIQQSKAKRYSTLHNSNSLSATYVFNGNGMATISHQNVVLWRR